MLEINDLKVELDYKIDDVYNKISKKLKINKEDITYLNIQRRSVDARNGIFFVLKVNVRLKNELYYKRKYNLKEVNENDLVIPKAKECDCIVVGMGPAGLLCAYILAKAGVKPTIIERGMDVDNREQDIKLLMEKSILNKESNILFGEGGAGTFSDGKLGTGIKDENIRFLYKTFVKHGAPDDILIDALPHIGTDNLRNVVKSIRNEIINLGGKVLFNHRLDGIVSNNGIVESINVFDGTKKINMKSKYLVLAIGHSARDTFYMLKDSNIFMEQKNFSIGVRIEHKREDIDKMQYKEMYNHPMLKSASYKLSYIMENKRGVYSFCMCPGGVVVPSISEDNMIATNGMSYYKRDADNSNAAILVSVFKEDYGSSDPLAGIEFQRKYERLAYNISNSYKAPVQLVKDFYENKVSTKLGKVIPSYKPGYVFANLNEILPEFVSDGIKRGLIEFDKKMHGFKMDDAILTGIESRSSSPVRIVRNEEYESNIKGIYPIGEGAGYAGGITSSAVDGIKIALKIINKELV